MEGLGDEDLGVEGARVRGFGSVVPQGTRAPGCEDFAAGTLLTEGMFRVIGVCVLSKCFCLVTMLGPVTM